MTIYRKISAEDALTEQNAVVVWIDLDGGGEHCARVTSSLGGAQHDVQPDAVDVPEALILAQRLSEEQAPNHSEIKIVLNDDYRSWNPAWGILEAAIPTARL